MNNCKANRCIYRGSSDIGGQERAGGRVRREGEYSNGNPVAWFVRWYGNPLADSSTVACGWIEVQGFSRRPKVGRDDRAVRMVVWKYCIETLTTFLTTRIRLYDRSTAIRTRNW
jgi:hypothetical protein